MLFDVDPTMRRDPTIAKKMKSIRTQSRAGNPIRRPPNSGGGESSSGYASSSGYSSASSSVAFEGTIGGLPRIVRVILLFAH